MGVGHRLTRRLWRAGGTPKTHLVLPFYGAGGTAVATKHFLSAVKPFCLNAAGPAAASAYSEMPQDLNPRPVHPSGYLAGSAQNLPAVQRWHSAAQESTSGARPARDHRSAAATYFASNFADLMDTLIVTSG